MEQVELKHTNFKVSKLCFGAMTFGGQADEGAAARMMDRCLDAGINFFDTANVYTKGSSEIILGKLLKGRRGRVVLATKAGYAEGLAPAAIRQSLDDSLRRLGTDHVDLYYLHKPDYAVPVEETLGAIDELVKAGKVRCPGTSNFASWQVAQMLSIAEKRGYQPAWVSQPMYNLLARGIEQEFLPMCRELGVASVVYNPLAGGLLTGKHRREAPIGGSRFDNNQMYLDRYWHPGYFDAVEELRGAAERAGRSLVSLSLAWLLHHTAADCVILGASRPEQLDENLEAAGEGPLAADTVAACDQVWDKLRGITPKYNR